MIKEKKKKKLYRWYILGRKDSLRRFEDHNERTFYQENNGTIS